MIFLSPTHGLDTSYDFRVLSCALGSPCLRISGKKRVISSWYVLMHGVYKLHCSATTMMQDKSVCDLFENSLFAQAVVFAHCANAEIAKTSQTMAKNIAHMYV